MRNFNKFAMGTLLVLVIAHSIQASPRSRRRARRANQNYSTPKTYSSNNNVVANNPVNQPTQQTYSVAPVVSSQPYMTQPATSTYQVAPATAATAAPLKTLSETRTLDEGDLLPADPVIAGATTIAQASYEVEVAAPSTTTTYPQAQPQPQLQTQRQMVYPASSPSSFSTAIAEVNAIRARRGLYAFIEDPALSGVAYQKASIQANRRAMGHPGGSMGGARYEGVGMGAQFTSCYLYSSGGQYAGAASVRAANGQRYHCLLVK